MVRIHSNFDDVFVFQQTLNKIFYKHFFLDLNALQRTLSSMGSVLLKKQNLIITHSPRCVANTIRSGTRDVEHILWTPTTLYSTQCLKRLKRHISLINSAQCTDKIQSKHTFVYFSLHFHIH